jgi:hypothetical protein
MSVLVMPQSIRQSMKVVAQVFPKASNVQRLHFNSAVKWPKTSIKRFVQGVLTKPTLRTAAVPQIRKPPRVDRDVDADVRFDLRIA